MSHQYRHQNYQPVYGGGGGNVSRSNSGAIVTPITPPAPPTTTANRQIHQPIYQSRPHENRHHRHYQQHATQRVIGANMVPQHSVIDDYGQNVQYLSYQENDSQYINQPFKYNTPTSSSSSSASASLATPAYMANDAMYHSGQRHQHVHGMFRDNTYGYVTEASGEIPAAASSQSSIYYHDEPIVGYDDDSAASGYCDETMISPATVHHHHHHDQQQQQVHYGDITQQVADVSSQIFCPVDGGELVTPSAAGLSFNVHQQRAPVLSGGHVYDIGQTDDSYNDDTTFYNQRALPRHQDHYYHQQDRGDEFTQYQQQRQPEQPLDVHEAMTQIAPLPSVAKPSTNQQQQQQEQYVDMGSNGDVSQDWLDTICRHLIEHMNNFGICVIDNFLGSIKGELILKEVHQLYSNGQYSKGRLVSNKLEGDSGASNHLGTSNSAADLNSVSGGGGGNDGDQHQQIEAEKLQRQQQQQQQRSESRQSSMQQFSAGGGGGDRNGTIRNDRVIWVDGCEDGCSEINNLIQTLCSVVTNSSRLSLWSNNGLDKVVINKRTKAHVACYPGNGTRYIKHVDNPNGDGRVITAIYYLNKSWNTKRDGGLLRMFPAGMDEVANIEPLFDRVLFFWSDRRNPHEVLPAYRDRFAITVWYIGETRPGL